MSKEELSIIFKALSDKNRMQILAIINQDKEVCVCKIQEHFTFTQPTLSYHLGVLQDANLINCHKEGINCIYQINEEVLNKVKNYLTYFN